MSRVTALLPDGPSIPFEATPLPAKRRRDPAQACDAPETAITVLESHALDTATPDLELEPIELQMQDDPFLRELLPFVEQRDPVTCDSPFTEETPTQKLRPWTSAVQPLVPLHFELTPLPAQVSEWSQLTTLLSDYLLTRGHTRASALVAPLLNAELVDLSRLDDTIVAQLQREGVASLRGTRFVSSPSFRSSAHVLREELANGGIDANEAIFWLAQLMSALMGSTEDFEAVERTLRDVGIARLLDRAA